MRASKKSRAHSAKRKRYNQQHSASGLTPYEIHVSGAEGLYKEPDISRMINEYIARAINHPRGKPDTIAITLEKLRQKPLKIQSLPVKTIKSRSRLTSERYIRKILLSTGISEHAIEKAFSIVQSAQTLRGAALVTALSGSRIDPDKERGVRVSRLGITEKADRILSRNLAGQKINITAVKEAIILASKVASRHHIMAELCISDDPDYTTGYVSSRKYGYVRIPHIKRKKSKKGGRVFFVAENTDVEALTEFLETSVVMINKIADCSGVVSLHEILDSNNK